MEVWAQMAKAVFRGLLPPDDPLFKTVTIFFLNPPKGLNRLHAVPVDDAAKTNEERPKPPGDSEDGGAVKDGEGDL